MLKRLLAALCCAACMALAGCSFIWPDTSSSQTGSDTFTAPVDQLREYQDKWCYQRLDGRLQKAYSAVYAAVVKSFSVDETVTITDTAREKNGNTEGYRLRFPNRCWVRRKPKNSMPLSPGTTLSFSLSVTCMVLTGIRRRRQPVYHLQADVCHGCGRTQGSPDRTERGGRRDGPTPCRKTPRRLRQNWHSTMRWAARCRYDTAAAEAPSPAEIDPYAFSAYGAIVQGEAVCEGYARAMQFLLQRADIPAMVVTGFDENRQPHMWNLVTIDGRNYHLDVTWDDSGDQIRHTYFNLTSREIFLTHSLDDENMGIDTCIATEANYFIRTGAYFTTYSLEDIVRVVARQVDSGAETIELRFAPDKLQNGLLFIQQPNWFSSTVSAKLEEGTMWLYDYEVNQTYGIITIVKKAEG